jgi:hypothetical protein
MGYCVFVDIAGIVRTGKTFPGSDRMGNVGSQNTRMKTAFAFFTSVVVFTVGLQQAGADERLAGIACRSVHLQYEAPAGQAFYNEVIVTSSAPGTYFCVCGFEHGYFGIQELGDKKKVVIFSVWDPGKQDDPNAVKDDVRVKLVHQGKGVRVGRFGNEGTGGQSFLDLNWKPGETYRFLVTAKPDGERTQFSGYVYRNDEKSWLPMVTFSTITKEKSLSGYYSFVEDFRRNRESARQARSAKFGHGWVQAADGKWQAIRRARFTADSNPATNINANAGADFFVLSTGGDTANTDAKLRDKMNLTSEPGKAPEDLPQPTPAKALDPK